MPPQRYHVFLSYARADNSTGVVTGFVERLQADYLRTTGRDLRVFFDLHAIEGMDHWRHKILEHLGRSHVLLAILSPSYLDSPYCQWEFSEYLKGEISHELSGTGVTPIYFFEIPSWCARDYDVKAPEWVRALRSRQMFDLRADFTPSAALVNRLADRIGRAGRADLSPGNLDRHNEYFTGREMEMERLRKRLVTPAGSTGFTILHGLGGMGKTSLAIEYGHNFADHYPAGRWQARCAGAPGIHHALTTLAGPLGLSFHEQEPATLQYRAERVLAELQRRALENGDPRACLLILDNVDNYGLLAASQTRLLPRVKWLHVLITSQLGPADLPDLDASAFLPVDELPFDDSLLLLEKHQADGRFRDDEEQERAQSIVRALGGFTLALESAAVSWRNFLRKDAQCCWDAIEAGGLLGFERTAVLAPRQLLIHNEKRLTATLQPIFDRLGPDERRALQYASYMPPNTVIWDWIECLVGHEFPEVSLAERVGEFGRWTAIRNRLLSLRLLTGSSEEWAGRMHGLVQEVVWSIHGFHGAPLERNLKNYAFRRCGSLERDWDVRDGRLGDRSLADLVAAPDGGRRTRRWGIGISGSGFA